MGLPGSEILFKQKALFESQQYLKPPACSWKQSTILESINQVENINVMLNNFYR